MSRRHSLCQSVFQFILFDITFLVFLVTLFVYLPSPLQIDGYPTATLLAGKTLTRVYLHENFDTEYDWKKYFSVDYKLEFDQEGRPHSLVIGGDHRMALSMDGLASERFAVKSCTGDPEGIPHFPRRNEHQYADIIIGACLINGIYEHGILSWNTGGGMELMTKRMTSDNLVEVWLDAQVPTIPLMSIHLPSGSETLKISFPSSPLSMSPSSTYLIRFGIFAICFIHGFFIFVIVPGIFTSTVAIIIYVLATTALLVLIVRHVAGHPPVSLRGIIEAVRRVFWERLVQGEQCPSEGQVGAPPADLEAGDIEVTKADKTEPH